LKGKTMADEEVEVEKKSKGPLIKMILLVVGLMLVLVGTVVGTLFVSGAFDHKPDELMAEKIKELEAKIEAQQAASKGDDCKPDKDGHGCEDGPKKKAKESPELQRFESSYLELEKNLLANLTGSRKVMSVNIGLMTFYDDRVFKNVKKHEVALRSVALDVMRQTTEADLSKPDFRKELAASIRDAMNGVLMKYEDFGGIEGAVSGRE
jgi:flagellar FliL protein